jgi:diguanylate cyclase (GGDEF)-like protein
VGPDELGVLILHHDRPHNWADDDLDALATLAAQSSVALRTARDYGVMAQWAAQLQSIQQLGARLNRLTNVADIGLAIATELRDLIDYHNVRVYRVLGEDLVPVAMKGQVGEYVDERPEELRVRIGQGITGWVAEHRVPVYLADAAADPRANTIAGTEEDLDESMLLAPMVFEDDVLGVVVLSKLGLNQFGDDDLRLLVIYASFAAQAMANADATAQLREQSEALERQLRSQRELLQITESILTTLEPTALLDQIADRLGELVGYDNISIEVYDRATRVLHPLTARGIHAADYMQEWEIGETGVATWVIERNEPVLIVDQFDDPRVQHFDSTGRIHGGLVVVPLRGREGVTGVLTVERLGEGNTFRVDEFELIQLFAAQVSIALQNAEVHRAVEIRARTDNLTRLLNHGTFQDRLADLVSRSERFGLVMIDLDEFKSVNDALGHQAGDLLLSQIASAIVGASRESDLVFRYGGDEFAVLLPGADAGAAATVASRIRESVHAVGHEGTAWHASRISVSASFGLAGFPDHGTTAEAVLLAADRACFVAKRAGRGRIATADEGLALAAEFSLQEPTPVDPPSVPAA